jgi:DNA-binding NarL/FixJ family response regulator
MATMESDRFLILNDLRQRVGSSQSLSRRFELLTARQVAVMDRLACGHSNKEIAQSLSLSNATIKTYVQAIYEKTQLPNRIQLAIQWLKHRNVITEVEKPVVTNARVLCGERIIARAGF